mgnify:CR=1 FL=1|jgi:hypothetical protein
MQIHLFLSECISAATEAYRLGYVTSEDGRRLRQLALLLFGLGFDNTTPGEN